LERFAETLPGFRCRGTIAHEQHFAVKPEHLGLFHLFAGALDMRQGIVQYPERLFRPADSSVSLGQQ
jgi:hypothetical protein